MYQILVIGHFYVKDKLSFMVPAYPIFRGFSVRTIFGNIYLPVSQLLVVLLMATGLCDLGYTVYQAISGDYGGVAQYLYFSPSTIVVTAV